MKLSRELSLAASIGLSIFAGAEADTFNSVTNGMVSSQTVSKVGIGTAAGATPAQKLTLSIGATAVEYALGQYAGTGASGNTAKFRIGAAANAAATDWAGMEVRQVWNAPNANATNNQLGFFTATGTTQTERMSILANGNVGVGTASPSALLNVSTSAAVNADVNIARFGNKISTGRTMEMSVDYRGSMGDGTLVLREDRAGVDFMTINMLSTANKIDFPNGNIGIGLSTNPSAKLDVDQNTSTGNEQIFNLFANSKKMASFTGSDGGTAGFLGLYQKDNANPIIQFDARALTTKNSYINAGGFFGVGTSTPQALLHVKRDGVQSNLVLIQGNAGGNATLKALNLSNGNTPGSGNLGQAVDVDFSMEGPSGVQYPAARLHVGKESDWTNSLSNVDSYLGISTTLDGQTSERMRIAANGNVGIGTTVPMYNLDLYGGMRIYSGTNTNDFVALTLRAGSNGGDKTRIKFTGDNGGDYAEILGTSTNPVSGNGTPTAGSLTFRTRNGANSGDMRDQMTITESGKFILGGPAANLPLYELHPTDGSSATNNGNGSSFIVAAGACDNTSTKYGGNLYLRPGGKNANIGNYGNVAIADDGGQVGIGTDNPGAGYKLDVRGDATISGALTVASITTHVWSVAPDYVFEKDYALAPLERVEKYVDEHKHLPDVPSAKEIHEKGLDLADMNLKLLRKVEELTLYSIKQEKRISELSVRLEKVEKR